MINEIKLVSPKEFDQDNHFYPKALNAQLHSMVSFFFNLNHDRIMERYIHLHPQVDRNFLQSILEHRCKYFYWGGADLFYVTTEKGNRKMVILETNSCPSGQKSMPQRSDAEEHRGYRYLIENSFLPITKKKRLPEGKLAVLFDKNYMETSGYASTLADLSGEDVYLIPHYNDEDSHISFENGVMMVNDPTKGKVPIRACLRYVTQKPWNRIPIESKTLIYNSVLVCLAGGRNKLLASKAYEIYNSEIEASGLRIQVPETIRDVSKVEIPIWLERFGGYAVIKIPYSNAGQGVFTITSQKELDRFMEQDYEYDQFIVQSLIGHYDWSSRSQHGKYYHIGTVPNKKGDIFIADLRVMVYNTLSGFEPCAIYARRGRAALTSQLNPESWQVLGTNLSRKVGKNQWDTDTSRLMLMDRKDFNTLGIGTDDLIEAYIQTILTIIAIDKMAQKLISTKGNFRTRLFRSLDNDESLLSEIM